MRSLLRACSSIVLSCSLLAGVARAGVLNLPSTPVTFYALGADDDAFFHVTLSGVPAGFDVHNQLYGGYCVAIEDAITPVGLPHSALLYDTTDASAPANSQNTAWNYINYILNHKQGVADDVQNAIWQFTDGTSFGTSAASQAMIADALANGATFVPTAGQLVAVIVDATENAEIQTLIIEVPVPPTTTNGPGTGTIGYWKNHPTAWPVSSITLGGVSYTRAQAIAIMKKAVAGDKTLNLADQLIGAKLNVLVGNESGCIDSTIAAADAFLAAHPIGSKVSAGSSAWVSTGGALLTQLDAYNNGKLCAPHRK